MIMKPSLDSRWLSVEDVSVYLGVKSGTVYKWVERNGLPAKKIGRLLKFRRMDVDAWVEAQSDRRGSGERGETIFRRLKEAAPDIKKRFGVRRIGLFGSAARNEAEPRSDIDILVEFAEPSFDRYMDLKFHLESLFGRPCDLVIEDSLKKGVRESVRSEVRYV